MRRASPGLAIAALAVLLGGSGCNYTFRAGAGLPPHVRTIAIVPFENRTERFEVSEELHALLLEEIPDAFGVRTGGEEFAEAVVRGTVTQYRVEAPNYRPGAGDQAQVIERQVVVTVEVQVVDRVNNLILWENRALTQRGEFLEESQVEEEGRDLALSRVAQAIIDGLQSNW